MTTLTARAYSYIFFRVSPERQMSATVCPDALSCFEKWVNEHDLKIHTPQDMKMPGAVMLHLAMAGDISVCILRFHDLDIVEIGQKNADVSPELWEKNLDEIERQLRETAFFAITHLLSTSSLPMPPESLKDKPQSQIPGVGKLYQIKHNAYLLHSWGEKTTDFITRDFPLMASALHKLEFEEGELRKLKKQNQDAETQIQKLMKEGLQAVEAHFEDIRKYQTRLRQTVVRQSALRQTLQINIRNIRNIGKNYLSPENDSLFTPRIRRFRNLYGQIRYDLNYARLNAEEIESQIQLLELQISQKRLKIEQRREEGEKRFARWLGLIAVPLGIGGATTNMPNTPGWWIFRLAMMGIGGVAMYYFYERLSAKDERRDK